MQESEAMKERTPEPLHGRDCPKVDHLDQRGGYLHAADDDRPYDVDGVAYCGRCHGWIGSINESRSPDGDGLGRGDSGSNPDFAGFGLAGAEAQHTPQEAANDAARLRSATAPARLAGSEPADSLPAIGSHPHLEALKIQKAREAVAALRDAARDGAVIGHFRRDPLVSAIHAAIDIAEELSSSAPAQPNAETLDPIKAANSPLHSFDARDWAKEFCDIYERNHGTRPDEGWMIGWFANALMRGYDEHRWKMEPRLRELAMLALCANNTTPTMRQGLVAIAEIVGCLVHGRFADAEERLRSMLHGDSPSPSPEKG